MRSWILIAAAVGLLSYAAVSHALKRAPAPQPPVQPGAPAASAEPVVLEQVVDVTNIDSLLEPRAATDDGAPFEVIEFPARAAADVAPAPRPVSRAPNVYVPSGVTVGCALYF